MGDVMEKKLRDKPKVGQVLYSLNIGNMARNQKQELTPVTVKKVGRKYFTCGTAQSWRDTQYYIDNWGEKSDYVADSKLYSSHKEWEDEKEEWRICQLIYDSFQYGNNKLNLSLSVLLVIDEALAAGKIRSKRDAT